MISETNKPQLRKPNLTIEIEEPNDDFNDVLPSNIIPSDVLPSNLTTTNPPPPTPMKDSNCSNFSNKSQRQIILQRAQRNLIQSRLCENVKSLNSFNRNLMKSRQCLQSLRSSVTGSSKGSRIKSDKKPLQNIIKSQLNNNNSYNNSSHRRSKTKSSIIRSKSASQMSSLSNPRASILINIAQKLKNKREDQAIRNKSIVKSKLNKLGNLLQDIKKCNRQSNKVVYTITKSKKSSPKGSQAMRNNEEGMRKLAKELLTVREELKEVREKRKNQENGEYSYETISNSSSIQNNPYYRDCPPSPTSYTFKKIIGVHPSSEYYVTKSQKVQPCFACGCSCSGRMNREKMSRGGGGG